MTMDSKRLLVYGSMEFGHVVREQAVACGYSFAGFVDDWNAGPDVIGTFDEARISHPRDNFAIALAIGYKDLPVRREIAMRIRTAGYQMPDLVHPEAYVAPGSSIGQGVIVMARACVDMRVRLGDLTVVWPGAVISHDCIVQGNTFISPGATVCGHCRIGVDTFLGAGSTVVDHIEVPDRTFVKAGEVFTPERLEQVRMQSVCESTSRAK